MWRPSLRRVLLLFAALRHAHCVADERTTIAQLAHVSSHVAGVLCSPLHLEPASEHSSGSVSDASGKNPISIGGPQTGQRPAVASSLFVSALSFPSPVPLLTPPAPGLGSDNDSSNGKNSFQQTAGPCVGLAPFANAAGAPSLALMRGMGESDMDYQCDSVSPSPAASASGHEVGRMARVWSNRYLRGSGAGSDIREQPSLFSSHYLPPASNYDANPSMFLGQSSSSLAPVSCQPPAAIPEPWTQLDLLLFASVALLHPSSAHVRATAASTLIPVLPVALAPALLPLLLQRLNADISPAVRVAILRRALPSLARNAAVLPLVLRVLLALLASPKPGTQQHQKSGTHEHANEGRSSLHAVALVALYGVWMVQPGVTFPHLERAVAAAIGTGPSSSSSSTSASLESRIAAATVIRDVCVRHADHGCALVPFLHSLLSDANACVAALAIDALHALCAADCICVYASVCVLICICACDLFSAAFLKVDHKKHVMRMKVCCVCRNFLFGRS